MTRIWGTLILLGCVAPLGAFAADAPPLPRFESLKATDVFMREGPSTEHAVRWVYHRKGLPVEVIAEFEVWRRVRDMDGEVGWVHVAMLSRDRTAVIIGRVAAPVRRREDGPAPVIAQAQPGAIGKLESCGPIACQLNFGAAEGWVDRDRLWGVRADEHL